MLKRKSFVSVVSLFDDVHVMIKMGISQSKAGARLGGFTHSPFWSTFEEVEHDN